MHANESRARTPHIVSRDFITGACDSSAAEIATGGTAHDYARKFRGDQTIRDRAALSRKTSVRKPSYPLNECEHTRRLLRTEFNGGVVIGFVFGAFVSVVILALSSPWWAPIVAWMVQR